MSNNRMVAGRLLGDAADTVLVKRPGVHGNAEQSFDMIAELWTVYIKNIMLTRSEHNLKPRDVAQMMSLLKKARAMYGDVTNEDNFVDDLGYTALAGMLQLPDDELKLDEEQFMKDMNLAEAEQDAPKMPTLKSAPDVDETTVDYDPRSAGEILGEIYARNRKDRT